MKARVLFVLLLTVGFVGAANATPLRAQQGQASSLSVPAACGVDNTDFVIKKAAKTGLDAQAPEGKALVYVIEQMPNPVFLTSKVKIGLDGSWIGETERQEFLSFSIDPGVHHLCVAYQGQFAEGEDKGTFLHRLTVEPGKTYYLLYRGLLSKGYGEVGFFSQVDEDEGRYLLQLSQHVTAVAKK